MKPVGIIEQCIRLRIRPELTIRKLLEMPQDELDALTERMHELATAGNVLDDIVKPAASSLPIMIVVIGIDGRAHYLDERHGFTLCARKADRRADSLDADREGCSECLIKWCEILGQHLGTETEGDTMAEQKAVDEMFDVQRFGELLMRYSGTLSQIIRDHAQRGIHRHREDLTYLARWGIDETQISGKPIDSITSETHQSIARLKEQLELAELLMKLDLREFAGAVKLHFEHTQERARQES